MNSINGKMKNAISIISLCITLVGFNSCRHSTDPNEDNYLPSPYISHSADEIKGIERISTIHFVVVNNSDTMSVEYYIDTNRIKIIANDGTMRVLYAHTGWYYYSHQVTYETWHTNIYDQNVQELLGSYIKEPIQRIGLATLDDKNCEIITDSTRSLEEWIWIDHRMPIQEEFIDNGYITKKIIIEVNQLFPDSLFDPPK
jgi:hypothetical protein